MQERETRSRRIDDLHREDLITFLNAAKVCTGQAGFYGDGTGQSVSIGFLHDYVFGNYRHLYARCLAAGINDFNAAEVISNLLRHPPADPDTRRTEGELIAAGLHHLPPQRAYRLLAGLRGLGVCNRRTRVIARDYLATRPDRDYHAVKYRRHVKQIVRHFHLRTPGETGTFLFQGHRQKGYATPLFDTFRKAHYSQQAIYDLPYTIAEGLAGRFGIPRDRFLKKIAPQLTQRERVRLQARAQGMKELAFDDLGEVDLMQLATFVLSRPLAERKERHAEFDAALRTAARRSARRSGAKFGRVAIVLDNSYSTTGSRQTFQRPLALAVAAHYLLAASADRVFAHWVSPLDAPVLAVPRGHTDLATPLLRALGERVDTVLVLSDGRDNDPPGGAAAVAHAFRQRVDPDREVAMFHLNPTFDAASYGTKGIHEDLPMLGIRHVEDIPMMLAFARFVAGRGDLDELTAYLDECARRFVGENRPGGSA